MIVMEVRPRADGWMPQHARVISIQCPTGCSSVSVFMFLEYGFEVLRLRRLGHLRQRAQDFFPAKQMSLSVS